MAPPDGTRDLLPPEAASRRRRTRAIAEVLELHGYALVTTPPFELAETIERGAGGDPRDTLRFVDPETGEICVFRPDLTVQVARLVASGLRDRPAPHRLFYEGHVLRARRGRGRRQRQIAQIGAECIGISGARGDAEVIELASRALEQIALVHHVEIAAVPMVRALLEHVPPTWRTPVTEALGRKDRHAVQRALEQAGVDLAIGRAVLELEGMVGRADVLERARRTLAPFAASHLSAVEALAEELSRRGLSERLRFDLGEVRGFDYYTGPSFSLLADGPGEALGGGGRYDELLGRFGAPLPASGFAIDLDHVARAIEAQGAHTRESRRVQVTVLGAESHATLSLLRARGIGCTLPGTDDVAQAMLHARAWQLDAVIAVHDANAVVHWVDGPPQACAAADVATLLLSRAPHGSEDGT